MVDKWKTWTRDSLYTKMGADKLARNAQNAPKFYLFAHIVCPSPKVWDFDKKGLHWAALLSLDCSKIFLDFRAIMVKVLG